ncbi:protein kinase [Streptosporangium sp. NBC_01639]|uniref:serine/threonine-protein kinase n=1 Tax=Streptosporangium sp. NBC_01639 TaxID=2975948 RepID=UPI00386C451D|nr:protein kinase [Streptosporangium sp. NBC_01639]
MSHQYGPAWHPQPPLRSTTGLSVVWALVPLFTCGIGTPFIMGHAAYRLRSTALALVTVLYGFGIGVFVVGAGTYGDSELIPVWLDATMMIGLFGNWLGGLGHALIIRGTVFRPHPQPGPYPAATPAATPVPGRYPHHAPGPAPAPFRAPATPHTPYPPGPGAPTHTPYPLGATHLAHPSGPPASHTPYPPGPGTHTPYPPGPGASAYRPRAHRDQAERTSQGWLGPYRLLGTLGRGGQGTVHLALTPQGQKVAIKVLHEHFNGDPTVRDRFLREVEATRRVATFSTARVLDVSINDDQAYVVSEYVDGASLEQLIRDQGPHNEDGLTRLALATAGALAAIHRAGVVHRDFKPANVLIGADGPRVIDFGIARALDQATATSSAIMGTPAYMSPEQLAGGSVGPESDVFSWAATMIFAASGRVAFGEDTIPAILNRVINHHPDLTALPRSLRPLAAACLEKQPGNRPTAADVMLRIVN